MTVEQDAAVERIIERFTDRHPRALDDIAERALLDQLTAALRARFDELHLDLADPTVRRAALVSVDLVLKVLENIEASCGPAIWQHSCVARSVAAYIAIERHHQDLDQ